MNGRAFAMMLLAATWLTISCAMSAIQEERLEPVPALVGTPGGGAAVLPSDCITCEREGTKCPNRCCIKNWYRCTPGKRCCSSNWSCVKWKYGVRCEPPCVKNWYRCDRGNSYCCGGWRCKNWTYGKRCEPN